MGYNTTVVIMNDALTDIKNDKEFGAKLAAAVSKVGSSGESVDVNAGGHCNAATVIESHHADCTVLVAVDDPVVELYNCSIYNKEDILKQLADELEYEQVVELYNCSTYNKEQILKELADKLGYNLVKKS